MLNGLRETRGVMSEEWRAGGGEARRTPDVRRVESIPIRNHRTGWITYGGESVLNKNVLDCPSSADRHRNYALLHPFAFNIPFMFATHADRKSVV